MMYDRLLQLPIFQGLSHDQLTVILEKVPFTFEKFRPNAYLVKAGDIRTVGSCAYDHPYIQ